MYLSKIKLDLRKRIKDFFIYVISKYSKKFKKMKIDFLRRYIMGKSAFYSNSEVYGIPRILLQLVNVVC